MKRRQRAREEAPRVSPEAMAAAAFDQADTDGDGLISREEFAVVQRSLSPASTTRRGGPQSQREEELSRELATTSKMLAASRSALAQAQGEEARVQVVLARAMRALSESEAQRQMLQKALKDKRVAWQPPRSPDEEASDEGPTRVDEPEVVEEEAAAEERPTTSAVTPGKAHFATRLQGVTEENEVDRGLGSPQPSPQPSPR